MKIKDIRLIPLTGATMDGGWAWSPDGSVLLQGLTDGRVVFHDASPWRPAELPH